MDARQRTHRGRGPALAAAILAVLAFGSVPAFAQIDLGPPVTVPPLPLGDGDDGSTPVPTTTTTTAPPPTTTTTTAPAPAVTTTTAAPTGTAPAVGGPTEGSRTGSTPARRSTARRTTPVADSPVDVAPAVASDEPAIARLRQVTLPAARQFGFPLGLAALVLAFLAVQGRLDARDPKLATAPLSIDDDLLPFT